MIEDIAEPLVTPADLFTKSPEVLAEMAAAINRLTMFNGELHMALFQALAAAVRRDQATILHLQSMIAGHANGYVPACIAIIQEAGAIRAAGNDGRGMIYGTESEIEQWKAAQAARGEG